MLSELVVSDLGVIEHGSVVFGNGMTALTGETGAGKTLVVEAIALLLGGRSETHLVRVGCAEARVDGRFHRVDGEVAEDIVLSRVVPRTGRSRAYVDGRPVPVSVLIEIGATLVDLHGQHAHQSLLAAGTQRASLDAFGGIDIAELRVVRAQVRALIDEQASLGGDERSRAREIDLLQFQIREIDEAKVDGLDEGAELSRLEAVLADAAAHREAGSAAVDALSGDGGARETISQALRLLGAREPFSSVGARLRSVAAEVGDLAESIRDLAEGIDDDPATLDATRRRRQKLRDLQRKYGEDLEAVLRFRADASTRLDELLSHDRRAISVAAEISDARETESAVFGEVVTARRRTAKDLTVAIESRLAALAMASARLMIEVDESLPDAGDGTVTFLLAANPGSEPLPLAKVASGGELARIMLALRLALLDGRSLVSGDPPDTLLFDEVDAGIGGQAAVAVGEALASMSVGRQVLVVTHLPQVAACADQHVHVRKVTDGSTTRTEVRELDDDGRVTELARMLSGSPDSATARSHAEELMATRRLPIDNDKVRTSRTKPTSRVDSPAVSEATSIAPLKLVKAGSGFRAKRGGL